MFIYDSSCHLSVKRGGNISQYQYHSWLSVEQCLINRIPVGMRVLARCRPDAGQHRPDIEPAQCRNEITCFSLAYSAALRISPRSLSVLKCFLNIVTRSLSRLELRQAKSICHDVFTESKSLHLHAVSLIVGYQNHVTYS